MQTVEQRIGEPAELMEPKEMTVIFRELKNGNDDGNENGKKAIGLD